MVEKVETEEENVMMGRAGAESEVTKRGKAVGIGRETGTGEEIETETGTMLTETEIMDEIGTVVDTDIKNSSTQVLATMLCRTIPIALN